MFVTAVYKDGEWDVGSIFYISRAVEKIFQSIGRLKQREAV